MKEYLDICMDLLCRLDRICLENNIKYAVSHGVAYAVENKITPPETMKIEVMMTSGDLEKFASIVNSADYESGFHLDYFKNNLMVDNFQARFINENTTLLNIKALERHDKFGIYIAINTINRVIEKPGNKKIKNSRRLFRFYFKRPEEFSGIRKTAKHSFDLATKILGKGRMKKILYNNRLRITGINCWENIKGYPLVEFRNKIIDSRIFEKIVRTNFNGLEVNILKENKEFLKVCYEDGSDKYIAIFNRMYNIIDPKIGYNDSLDILNKSGHLNLAIKYNKISETWRKKMAPLLNTVERPALIYKMTRRWMEIEKDFEIYKKEFYNLKIPDDIDRCLEIIYPYIEAKEEWKQYTEKVMIIDELESALERLKPYINENQED